MKATYNKSIPIYIDNNKLQYDPEQGPFIIKDANYFILGDSMIQSDEVEIKKRMGQILRNNKINTIEIGYSSWNPYQYENIFKKYNFNSNSIFFVFLYWNDFAPSYNMSYYRTLQKYGNSYPREKNIVIQKFKNFAVFFIENSFVVRTIFDEYIKYTNPIKLDNEISFKIEESHSEANQLNCDALNEIKEDTLIFDIISFSKDSSCWSDLITESVDQTIISIKRLKKIIPDDSEILFFFAPAGWSFENENTTGRKNKWFEINDNISISSHGLIKRIREDVDIFDLSKILSENKNDVQENFLYFAKDGHWTENSHKIIGKYLLSLINEKYVD